MMITYSALPLAAIGSCLLAAPVLAAGSTAGPGVEQVADTAAAANSTDSSGAAPAPATAPPALATIKDSDLGTSVIGRFWKYQAAEFNKTGSPLASDPNAPPSRRAGWAPAPATQPPYPFTEF